MDEVIGDSGDTSRQELLELKEGVQTNKMEIREGRGTKREEISILPRSM